MLFPSQSASEKIEQILTALQSGEIDHTTAGSRILEINPRDGEGYILLSAGAEKQEPPDLDRAEDLLWEALLRRPCDPSVYFSLADLRTLHRPDEALGKALLVLGMWKLAIAIEVPPSFARDFGETVGRPDLDWSDPHSYEIVADAWEEEIEERGEPPEVTMRLLPYRLLNRLQLESQTMTMELVEEILKNAGSCAPVFEGALWNWGRHNEAIDADSLRVLAAILGEIAGPEVVPDLLVLATHEDTGLMLHAHWGIRRIADRFPTETLAVFRAATPDAGVSLKCALAEQIGALPDIPGREAALLDLLQDFSRIAGSVDAPYLLLTTVYGLELIGRTLQARETLLRLERLVPAEGREWIRTARESDGGFAPMFFREGVNQLSREQVFLERLLVEDALPDTDEEEWDDEDEFPDEPFTAPPRPGRNDPCWCGSGKKYKKCHLDEDQEKERSGREARV
jgi:hypothetical protein